MTAVCGCGHPHLPGQVMCFACDLPVPTNVPPASALSPVSAAALPPAAAGGTQARGGSDD